MVAFNTAFNQSAGQNMPANDSVPSLREDLYFPGLDSMELAKAIAEQNTESQKTLHGARNLLHPLIENDGLPARISDLIDQYEEVSGKTSRIVGFIAFCGLKDRKNAAKTSAMMKRINSHYEYAALELLRLVRYRPKLLDAPELAERKNWFEKKQRWEHSINFANTEKDPTTNKLTHQKHETGRGPMQQMFEELVADIRIPVGDSELTIDEALSHSSTSENAERRQITRAIYEALESKSQFFTIAYNALLKDNLLDAHNLYGKDHAGESMHRQNETTKTAADHLATTVLTNISELTTRYYKWKAQKLGMEQSPEWAKTPDAKIVTERKYSWAEAKDIVLRAFYSYSQEMGDAAMRIFEAGAIDAAPDRAKAPGARCMPISAQDVPAVMLNFRGKHKDVVTLAHEVGHGVHFLLAGENSGQFATSIPTTIAETASLFAETLLYRQQSREAQSPEERKALTAQFIEHQICATAVQAAYHIFETKAHDERKKGPLSGERLNTLWKKSLKRAYGPNFQQEENAGSGWARIPHIFQSPFYTYAYTFGGIMALAILDKDDKADIKTSFRENVVDMLKTGGAESPPQLFGRFGFNLDDKDVWKRGVHALTKLMDDLDGQVTAPLVIPQQDTAISQDNTRQNDSRLTPPLRITKIARIG